jgi:hypothetical protein
MRFFEFVVGAPTTVDYRLAYQKQMIEEGYLRSKSLKESIEDAQYINEYREFISNYIQDPKQLSIGTEYFVIYLFAQPMAKTITIEYSLDKIKFLGIEDSSFRFISPNAEFRLPIYDDVDDQQYAPYFMSTNLYLDKDDLNQMITLIATKFGGRWNVKQKQIR